MKLNYTSIASAPFCDYLNVTMPSSHYEALQSSLAYLIETACLTSYDGITYSVDGNSGTLVIKLHARYLMLSASGGILQHFRNLGLYDEYISTLSEYPSKITRGLYRSL